MGDRRRTFRMKLSVSGLLLIVLGVVIVLTPWYIFPVCEVYGLYAKSASGANMIMPCGYTARAELGLGTVVALAGTVLLVAKSPETKRALGLLSAALGAFVVLFPTVIIGMCANMTHPCEEGTKPALILLGAVTILVSLYIVWKKK